MNSGAYRFMPLGLTDHCPSLPATFQPASVTVGELSETALSANSATFNTTAPSGDRLGRLGAMEEDPEVNRKGLAVRKA